MTRPVHPLLFGSLLCVAGLCAGCAESATPAMSQDAGPPGTDGQLPDGAVVPDGAVDAETADAAMPMPAVTELVDNTLEGPLDDLAPLGALTRTARFIAIGESIHGSDGMNDMRARAIRYLVEEDGVRVIGMEFDPSGLEERAIPYIATCEGTPEYAVGNLSNFAGAGNARLLEWLCQFNQQHPDDQVGLYGFDVLEGPHDIAFLVAQVESWELDHGAALIQSLQMCIGSSVDSTGEFYDALLSGTLPAPSTDSHQACLEAVDGFLDAYGTDDVDDVVIALRRLRWWENMWWESSGGHRREAEILRDEGMAWLTTAIFAHEFPDAERAALIAHNVHIAYDYGHAIPVESHATPRMGGILRRELGEQYMAIAQTALVTSAINIWFPNGTTYEAPRGSNVVERLLANRAGDTMFVSLETDYEQPFEAGAWYVFAWDEVILHDQWSGFFFLRNSPAGESYAEDF